MCPGGQLADGMAWWTHSSHLGCSQVDFCMYHMISRSTSNWQWKHQPNSACFCFSTPVIYLCILFTTLQCLLWEMQEMSHLSSIHWGTLACIWCIDRYTHAFLLLWSRGTVEGVASCNVQNSPMVYYRVSIAFF